MRDPRSRRPFLLNLALAAFLAALAGPAPLFAAPPAAALPSDPALPPCGTEEGAIATEGDIGKVQKRIADLRAWRMADELGFDEKTNARLFAVLRESDEKRVRLEAENRQILRTLRELTRGTSPDPEKLGAALDRLIETQKRQGQVEEEHLRRVRQVLDPVQMANYLFFELRFQRDLRERVVLTIRDRRGGMQQGEKGKGKGKAGENK